MSSDEKETKVKVKPIIPIKYKKRMDKNYFMWHQDTYHADEKLTGPLIKAKRDHTKSSAIRMINLSTVAYKHQYDTMNMIVVSMKIFDNTTNKEMNYGTLFCELKSTATHGIIALSKKSTFQNTMFTFFSAGPSYISCDGEYRAMFSLYKTIPHVKSTYPDIWDKLLQYIQRIKTRRRWNTYSSFFYPKVEQEKYNTEVELVVKTEHVADNILVVCWFQTVFDEYMGMSRSYVNENYSEIFSAFMADDLIFMKGLISMYTHETIYTLYYLLFHYEQLHTYKNTPVIRNGYKMIPLNFKEVQEPMNIKFKPWREIYVSRRFNDLVINKICPSFPITHDWFYIKNTRKGLFDNPSQYERLKHSEIAKEVIHTLYEAQRNTYFAAETLPGSLKTSKQTQQWVSSKFKQLNDNIGSTINFAIEEIIMSEVTLAFTNEYVGRTVADSINLLQSSKYYNKLLGSPLKPTGYNYFAKYMFEICYALYCINTKHGVIHGDLHLNNATIGPLYQDNLDLLTNANEENKIVYQIHGEQYLFPCNGSYACLIDFSRAIIDPQHMDDFKDQSLPHTVKQVRDRDEFITRENTALLNLYIHMFPNKMKMQEELTVLFKNHYDEVFKLLTCMDLYMFSIRLSRMMARHNKINAACKQLVDKINRLSEKYVATEMNRLITEHTTYASVIAEQDYPIYTIMKECFSEYLDGKKYKKIGTIIDVYNYENEAKHSLDKFALYPKFMVNAKEYKEVQGKKHIDDLTLEERQTAKTNQIKLLEENRAKLRTEYEDMKTKNLQMVSYIALRHQQKMV